MGTKTSYFSYQTVNMIISTVNLLSHEPRWAFFFILGWNCTFWRAVIGSNIHHNHMIISIKFNFLSPVSLWSTSSPGSDDRLKLCGSI